jgi:hypothetical protein
MPDTLDARPPPSVTYWAISVLNSRTVWVNTATLIVAVLSATDVLTLIPVQHLPLVTALLAALNVYLRTQTVRPVAFIPIGTTVPVTVAKLVTPPPLGSAA